MQDIKMNGFKRVSKRVARRLYQVKQPIWLTNHKLAPANMYNWLEIHQFNDDTYTFDAMIDNWTHYNANHEWGYYPAFYAKA